jgi:polar amino acid transport system substrate-binding protein
MVRWVVQQVSTAWRRACLPCLPLLLMSIACAAAPMAPYRIVAGELPPFSTQNGANGPGALVEITQELARRLGSPPPVEIYPWQRALMMARNLHRVAIVPLTRTPEREPQYRWLAHLYAQRFVFVARHGTVNVNDLDELRKRRIAVLRGSPHLALLMAEKFSHVIECASASECTRMIMTGVADASYGSEAVRRSSATLGGSKEADFDYSAPYRSGEIWLAGSLDFTDAEVARWRAAMAAMHADGSAARILRKYGLDPELDKH